jgi:hypothetical protein
VLDNYQARERMVLCECRNLDRTLSSTRVPVSGRERQRALLSTARDRNISGYARQVRMVSEFLISVGERERGIFSLLDSFGAARWFRSACAPHNLGERS